MNEPGWDLTSEDGLRAACAEAEKRIDPNRLARVTKFLAEVAAVPAAERASREFQKRIWRENPIRWTKAFVGAEALEDGELRQWFADRTNTALPGGWRERVEALWPIFWEAVNRPGFVQNGWRPRAQTLRALAALFPEHVTGALRSQPLQSLRGLMGGPPYEDGPLTEVRHDCRDQLLNSCWIRDRLDSVLGAPAGMDEHARRLLLSQELAELVSGGGASTVWLFRAGKDGEDEGAWLDGGVAFLGFEEVGDLTGCESQDDVRELVAAAYTDSAAGTITKHATELRQFAVDAGLRDFVVMPQKHQATVAIGRIAGHYAYAEVDGFRRHTRPVLWERADIRRDQLGDDLALNFRGTVCWLGGKKVGSRIEEILAEEPDEPLDPLSANRRRKGIPAVPGGFAGMLALLDYVSDHPSLEDILDYLRGEYPKHQERTLKVQLGQVRTGFGCIQVSGDRVELTELGRRLAQSRDPDVLRDDLLTKVLGPDHVIVELAGGARDQGDLVAVLQRANRGWGAAFGPLFQLNWLHSLDVVHTQEGGKLALTERGRRWRAAIHWTPEPLPPEHKPAPDRSEVSVPPLGEIVERIEAAARKRELAFSRELIESLHLGLWANERRHFAILAGLSGSGKTQLAMEYGRALTGADDESSVRLCAVSAAPGWHDPSPLLGYVNPLDGTYAGTDFQRFLLNAVGNPKEVHVCVLDEMNLSHPEQYLAPLLSAMEREGGMVEFHDSDEMALGVPQRIPYPRNLVLIGTVNMDETTMGLSDKVLDRAFTREFWDIDVDEWPGWEACKLADDERDRVRKLLNALTAALRAARLHFGWRVIAEFVAFLERRAADSAELPFERALDQITYAKVLPKLRGDDSQRFRTALEACRKVLDDKGLSASARKVAELIEDLDETGSFRFWR